MPLLSTLTLSEARKGEVTRLYPEARNPFGRVEHTGGFGLNTLKEGDASFASLAGSRRGQQEASSRHERLSIVFSVRLSRLMRAMFGAETMLGRAERMSTKSNDRTFQRLSYES